MNALDSYDALAASIERVLRTDLAPPGSATQLAGSIDRIMRDEATAGELRLGYLRLVVVAPLVVATGAMLVSAASNSAPRATGIYAGMPVSLGIAWLAASAALVLALRRGWYRRWLPHVVPVVDALVILVGFVATWRASAATNASSTALVAYVTALCAFLSLSGALRLSRWAARAGTGGECCHRCGARSGAACSQGCGRSLSGMTPTCSGSGTPLPVARSNKPRPIAIDTASVRERAPSFR